LTLDLSPGIKIEPMKIGKVAKEAGVGVDTLRYYERRGLISEPERRASGYREYPAETAQLIRFIKRAQDLGFSLAEIEELLQLRLGGRRDQVRGLAEQKLRDIDEKVSRLEAMREALTSLITACSCKTGAAPQCPIIEALDEGRAT
jgi:MerR family transcriptional regulator, copper efflux regulator